MEIPPLIPHRATNYPPQAASIAISIIPHAPSLRSACTALFSHGAFEPLVACVRRLQAAASSAATARASSRLASGSRSAAAPELGATNPARQSSSGAPSRDRSLAKVVESRLSTGDEHR